MPHNGLRMNVSAEYLPLAKPFRIAGHVFTETPVVVVTLTDGVYQGRGEAAGVYYLDDDVAHMQSLLSGVHAQVERGLTRAGLQAALPAGGARNALDCAYWELQARQEDRPVWELAGLPAPRKLLTAFTLGADTPAAMAQAAAHYTVARALKLKLTGDFETDAGRVKAVRAVRPDCWIGVDANQGYDLAGLQQLLPILIDAGVSLIEQPLARGAEAALDGFKSPIPLAADESALTRADLALLRGRFDMVNIKLDKCGGLTEALAMAKDARDLGLDVMVGNMTGSSLAMGPAFVLGQLCDVVDLDGPTFLVRDREPAILYEGGMAWCAESVWGRMTDHAAT